MYTLIMYLGTCVIVFKSFVHYSLIILSHQTVLNIGSIRHVYISCFTDPYCGHVIWLWHQADRLLNNAGMRQGIPSLVITMLRKPFVGKG